MSNNDVVSEAMLTHKLQCRSWDTWSRDSTCELWEAACLSLNIEPNWKSEAVQQWLKGPAGTVPEGFPPIFAERLRTFESLMYRNGFIEPLEPLNNEDPRRQTVRLLDVAMYCAQRAQLIPPCMYDIARTADPTLAKFDFWSIASDGEIDTTPPLVPLRRSVDTAASAQRARELRAMNVPVPDKGHDTMRLRMAEHLANQRALEDEDEPARDAQITAFVARVNESKPAADVAHGQHAAAIVLKASLEGAGDNFEAAPSSPALWSVRKEGKRFDALREVMVAFLDEADKSVMPPKAYAFIEYLQNYQKAKGFLPPGIVRVHQDMVEFSAAGKTGKRSGRQEELQVMVPNLRDRLNDYVRLHM